MNVEKDSNYHINNLISENDQYDDFSFVRKVYDELRKQNEQICKDDIKFKPELSCNKVNNLDQTSFNFNNLNQIIKGNSVI